MDDTGMPTGGDIEAEEAIQCYMSILSVHDGRL
jgi:hypothetical protein